MTSLTSDEADQIMMMARMAPGEWWSVTGAWDIKNSRYPHVKYTTNGTTTLWQTHNRQYGIESWFTDEKCKRALMNPETTR